MKSKHSSFTTGRHTHTGESSSIISPFPANSLTTKRFQWMHTESWNHEEIEFFLANRQFLPTSAHKAVPPVGRPTRTQAAVAGRWVLRGDGLVSSVEVQGFHNIYHRFHILLGTHPDNWLHQNEELALLTAAVILMGHGDQVTIVAPNAQSEAALHQFSWGRPETVWVPFAKLEQRGAGKKMDVLQIDAEDFWETTVGIECRKTLRYLERRVARTEACCDAKKPHRERGFFSRLLRFKH